MSISYSTNAAGVSKYTADRHQRILQDLLQLPGNDVCADCKSRAPRWSSWNLGIFICVHCASIHRKIGTHITKVKSVNLDAWTKEQLESVKSIGNINANAKWNPNEARHPPPTNLEESERDSEMEKYIRAKYEAKRFMDRSNKPQVNTSSVSASGSTPASANPYAQTVKLGFGRESRVEFSLGPGGDIFDGIVQQKKAPPRARTAPIPEPPKEVKPPVPALPTPSAQTTLTAGIPSRSISAQPPGVGGAPTTAGLGTGMGAAMGMGIGTGTAIGTGMATTLPTNPVWGDMMALQGSLPALSQTPDQSPMTQNNPYASLGVSPSLPTSLANRMNQTRSFTAPSAAPGLGGIGSAPNPFFQQQQQPQPTGSSMLTPTGGSFGSGNPYGTATGSSFGSSTGSSLGISTSGSFGTPVSTMQTNAFGTGASPSAFGTSMLSPQNSTQAFSPMSQQPSPFQTTQPSTFQTNTLSPYGANSNLGSSPNTNAFAAAMSPGGGAGSAFGAAGSNSPFAGAGAGMSNSPFLQTNVTGFQGGSSPFQTSNTTPFQQSTPSSNALFLQPNSTPFQSSNTPFQASNSPFPNTNSPYQTNSAFGQPSNNPFGPGTNPFGPQQQQQFQAQFQGQGQGWGGM
ncbi:GTPase activating protein for Arf protein [Ceratobasidium sp. AG-Ba]|nr:GTPase activating protein for Arf protein [Ceratobasidium sp. AG-Ba]